METAQRTNQHVYGERALWLKGEEATMAMARRLSVIIRTGDRSSEKLSPKQFLPFGERTPVYILDAVAAKGGPLGFETDTGLTMEVVRRCVTRLKDIVDADLRFNGGTAVPQSAQDVTTYLAEEMAPGKHFSPDDLFTIYWVEYLPDEPPATD